MPTLASRRWRTFILWMVPVTLFFALALLTLQLWRFETGGLHTWIELTLSAILCVAVFFVFMGFMARRSAELRTSRKEAERLQADEALRAAEERYRRVFHNATEGLMVLEADGTIIDANEAAQLIVGYRLGDLVGRSLGELVDVDLKYLAEAFVHDLEATRAIEIEVVAVRRDGAKRDVVINGVRFTHQGQPALLAIINDVTAQRLAVQRQARLSRKVLVAQEEERARVSRDLHDGLGQTLTALRLEVDWLRDNFCEQPDVPGRGFEEATAMIEYAADELRRICRGLRPPLLDDLGLEPSIEMLVEEIQEHAAVAIDLHLELDEEQHPLPAEIALTAFRILQESLTNVIRHARARKVTIKMVREYERLVLSVYDNGQGFDVSEVTDVPGFGIAGMRERAALVNGTFEIRSSPDQGTRVDLRIPMPPMRGEETP